MATDQGGMSLETTLPAPTVQPLPTVTPGRMTVPPPIQQSSPMTTGRANSMLSRREETAVSCVAAKMDTLGPNMTRSPIVTREQSSITVLCRRSWLVFLIGSFGKERGGKKDREKDSLHAGIEPLAQRDVTAIVEIQRGFDVGVLADAAQDLRELLIACLCAVVHGGVGVVEAWEFRVVAVAPFARLPPRFFQFRY